MLDINTIYILESKGLHISDREYYYSEYSRRITIPAPEGVDFVRIIYYNGTNKDFTRAFCEAARDFNPNDHCLELIPSRGSRGIPNSIHAIAENAEAIKNILLAAAEELRPAVPREFTVPVYVYGIIDIEVIAETVEEALEEAESIARKGNYGSLYDLEFSAEAAIDNNGNIYRG